MKSLGGTWVKTSYNGNIRGKYAGIGDFYDEQKDQFIGQIVPVVELSTPIVSSDE